MSADVTNLLMNPQQQSSNLACTTDETKLWLYVCVKQRRNPYSTGAPPLYLEGLEYEQWFAYLEIQNALLVIRRVQVGSVWFRLFGISLNTAKMKYVI